MPQTVSGRCDGKSTSVPIDFTEGNCLPVVPLGIGFRQSLLPATQQHFSNSRTAGEIAMDRRPVAFFKQIHRRDRLLNSTLVVARTCKSEREATAG